MNTVMEATQRLLQSKSPAEDLKLVDQYIRMWSVQASSFILPRQHAYLAPIINAFAGKLARFHKYVRGVRDECQHMYGERSAQYISTQALFRSLEVRLVQQQRRERAAQVAEWFRAEYPRVSATQRQAYVKRIEQHWTAQRLQLLNAYRKQHGGRLPEDKRRELLDEFWAEIDAHIKRGDLPPYE